MRSLILAVGCVFCLSVGFLVYYWLQPQHVKPVVKVPSTSAVELPLVQTSGGGFGPAKTVETEVFDLNTGDLSRSFKTDSFTRLRDGRFAVTSPVAKFYTWKSHQLIRVLRLEALSGIITPAHNGKNADAFKAHQMGAPSSGEMQVVTVTIQEPDAAGVLKDALTIHMPNAAFDNDSFKIYTQGYTDSTTGETFTKDRVPVTGVGDETHPDFDGWGLTMRWNERDKRLGMLEIAHGHSLTLKHTKKLAGGQAATASARGNSNVESRSSNQVRNSKFEIPSSLELRDSSFRIPADSFKRADTAVPLPAMLVDGDPAAAPGAIPTTDDEQPQPRRRAHEHQAATTQSEVREPHVAHTHKNEGPSADNIRPENTSALYRATFLDDVAIYQSGQQLVSADRMLVDFLMEQEHPATQSATEPTSEAVIGAPAPAAVPSAAPSVAATIVPPTTEPAAQAKHHASHPTVQPSTLAATQPATRPTEQEAPIIVHWTGKLIIQPLTESAERIPPGEEIITFEGTDSPVIAQQNSSQIRCSRLTYRTEDRMMTAEQAEKLPVTLTTSDNHGGAPTTIHTALLTFSSIRQVAVLRGRGSTDMPAQADGTSLKADWSKLCTIYFTPDDEGRSAIDHAEMEGDVHVNHPQFKLRSDLMDLGFETARPTTAKTQPASSVAATLPMALPAPDPTSLPSTNPATAPAASPASQSNLKQMVATGNVHCEMTDASKKTQTIDCNRLTVLTVPGPDGKMIPRTINADGDVHTVDPDQDMHAGTLTVLLKPSTRPSTRPAAVAANNTPDAKTAVALASNTPGQAVPAPPRVAATQPSTNPSSNVEVESMTAHDHVIVVTKDGTVATSDQLLVNMVDGKARVKLLGSPTAKIVDKQSTVIGAIISLNPDAQEMTVDGEGEMHAIQQESPGAAPRPMDVFWSRGLLVNGKDNFADAIGSVRALVNNADGSQDVAKGDHVRMLLADVPAPATRPTTQQAAPTRIASTSPTSQATTQASGGSLNLMGKKTVRQANFYDNAEVSSTLLDANGGLLRRMDVFAPTIIYDVLEKDGVSQKKVTIPCAGRMLVEDYRQPATQPAGQPANNNGGSSARGATAFQWSKKLIYDDATRQVVMEGSLQEPVMIDHRDDVEKSDPVRLIGDTVVADLEPIAPTPKPAALKPAPHGAAQPAATNPAATNPAAVAAAAPSNEPHFQIKKMTAHGHVLLTSRNSQLTADTMIYDPVTHWLHAIGNDRQPALYTKTIADQRGYQPITGDEMDYDTQDDAIKISKPVSRLHR